MNEKEREQVALFRYGLISPLFNEQVDPKEYFKGLEGKLHSIPYYGERKVAEKNNKRVAASLSPTWVRGIKAKETGRPGEF